MTTLILGHGYIGAAYARIMGADIVSRHQIDYTVPHEFEWLAKDYDTIINCAGFTGRPHIDECEVKRAETVNANVVLAANLSRVCAERGKRFVHLSSGCIFQGDGPYDEDAKPADNLSFYSLTKWLGDQAVSGYILRLRMPFDGSGHERCLLSKLAKYPRLINYRNSVTYVPDLVQATMALLKAEAPAGIYNVVNHGIVTHAMIAKMMGWHKEFVDISELDIKAPRSNCVLSGAKLAQYFQMPTVGKRLAECRDKLRIAA